VRAGPERDVAAAKADELGGPQTGVDHHREQRAVSASNARRDVRSGQQRVNLHCRQVRDERSRGTLGRDGEDPLNQGGVLRVLHGSESIQRMDRRQPAVARLDRSTAARFEVVQELADGRSIEVLEPEFGRRHASGFLHETEQEAECVSVSGHGVGARVPLSGQPHGEERLHGGC
jgi:hypothetical protein